MESPKLFCDASAFFLEGDEGRLDFTLDAELDPVPDPSPATVPQAQVASLEAQLIVDGLHSHVPAMQGGFEIMTTQGLWYVDGELARQMAELMRRHLVQKLAKV